MARVDLQQRVGEPQRYAFIKALVVWGLWRAARYPDQIRRPSRKPSGRCPSRTETSQEWAWQPSEGALPDPRGPYEVLRPLHVGVNKTRKARQALGEEREARRRSVARRAERVDGNTEARTDEGQKALRRAPTAVSARGAVQPGAGRHGEAYRRRPQRSPALRLDAPQRPLRCGREAQVVQRRSWTTSLVHTNTNFWRADSQHRDHDAWRPQPPPVTRLAGTYCMVSWWASRNWGGS